MKDRHTKRDFRLSIDKMSPANIRKNLLLASLYLAAFEILKLAIVEDVHRFFVNDLELYTGAVSKGAENSQADIPKDSLKYHEWQLGQYNSTIRGASDYRGYKGLIPSFEWLQKMGAVGNDDIEYLKNIRDHRNDIAHELPYILTGEGCEVNLTLFRRIMEILDKVDMFWIKMDLEITRPEINGNRLDELDDTHFFSGRVIIMNQILHSVLDDILPNQPDDSVS